MTFVSIYPWHIYLDNGYKFIFKVEVKYSIAVIRARTNKHCTRTRPQVVYNPKCIVFYILSPQRTLVHSTTVGTRKWTICSSTSLFSEQKLNFSRTDSFLSIVIAGQQGETGEHIRHNQWNRKAAKGMFTQSQCVLVVTSCYAV